MSRAEFYRLFCDLLHSLKPVAEQPDPDPDTHLWRAGYLDSVGMLEAVAFVEELIGRQIELDRNFLSKFFTMRDIYESFIAPVSAR